MFFDKGLASLHFSWIKRVDLGNLGDKVGVKFDGMIIGVVRSSSLYVGGPIHIVCSNRFGEAS